MNMKLYKDQYPDNWFGDYPTRPFGGDNPYHCCASCGRGVPTINYRLEGHAEDCDYRLMKEAELRKNLVLN